MITILHREEGSASDYKIYVQPRITKLIPTLFWDDSPSTCPPSHLGGEMTKLEANILAQAQCHTLACSFLIHFDPKQLDLHSGGKAAEPSQGAVGR